MAAEQPDKMKNVGPKSAAWLRQVGIRSREDLASHGAVGAFSKIKRAGFRPSLNLLYALEGALLDCHWQQLPEARRSELLIEVEAALALLPGAKGRAAGVVVERSGAEYEADTASDSSSDANDESDTLNFDDSAAASSDRGDD